MPLVVNSAPVTRRDGFFFWNSHTAAISFATPSDRKVIFARTRFTCLTSSLPSPETATSSANSM